MSDYLGKVTKEAKADPENPLGAGFWTIKFEPADIGIRVACEVYHIAIKGPTGSSFDVYLDTTFYDAVARGDKNSWDPAQPMHVSPGDTILFYYNTSNSPAPKATVFFRQPDAF